MLADEDDNGVELSLELCLGRPLIKPKRTEDEKNLVTDKQLVADRCAVATGFRDGSAMTVAVDNAAGLACDKYPAEFYQASCSVRGVREIDDRVICAQKFSNMSVTSLELPVAGYGLQDSTASVLRKSFSDAAGRLSNTHVNAQTWKDVTSQQHVHDQQRKRELHAQKRQAARTKRKLLIGEQKHQKSELRKNRPSPSSPTQSKSSLNTKKSVRYRKEGASKGLLKRTSNRDDIQEKHLILQEDQGAQFQDIRHAVEADRDTAMTDKELMFRSKPTANDEANLPIGYVSDHKFSQPTEDHNKSEVAQWIEKAYELRKMMNPNAPSTTQNIISVSEMASNFPSDAFQTDCRNSDQVDTSLKKAKISGDEAIKAMPAPDKGLESEDQKLLNDQMSSRDESSPIACFGEEAPAAPFLRSRLPTNGDSFIPTRFAFPLQNVNGFTHPVPNFMLAYQALGSYGESPCTSYQFSIPPGSTPFQRATLDTTASSGAPVFHPTPLSHPPISRTKRRKDPGRSRQLGQISSQGGAKLLRLLSNETPTLGIPSISGSIFSGYSRGRSFLDHAHSHTFSGTSSGIQEEVAASGPSHSGKSSSNSSSEAHQSAHWETVESYPTRSPAHDVINVEAIPEHDQQTATEPRAAVTHKELPSSGGLLVSTTANSKTIKGVLQIYNEREVKIRCDCHGNYMNALEFVVHAGGIADPHPERMIIVINPSMFANP